MSSTDLLDAFEVATRANSTWHRVFNNPENLKGEFGSRYMANFNWLNKLRVEVRVRMER